MTEFWEGIRPLLDALGTEPWMYGILIAFGVIHQFLCGYFEGWRRPHSFFSALGFAILFGGLSAFQHGLTPLAAATRITVLLASALLSEVAANKLAGIIPGVPKYNEKVP
jgi:hypothetical protein